MWLPVAAFDVAGTPKGQPRPRACIRGRHASVYNPATADGWRQAVTLASLRDLPEAPLDVAVWVVVDFRFPRAKRRPSGAGPWHTAKPDIDNAVKLVLDAMTDAGWWADDALVVACNARKTVAAQGQEPGATIHVYKED